MTQFKQAAEHYQNRQYEDAYRLFSSLNDRHSQFNAAIMEAFGKGTQQNLAKAEERLQELSDSGMKEADEPLLAIRDYLKHAEIYNTYKEEYLKDNTESAKAGMQRMKEQAAEAVSRLRQCILFGEEEIIETAEVSAVLSEEDKNSIYQLLAQEYADGQEDDLPKMLAVMQRAGYTKERYGVKSLTKILPQLPFIRTEQNKAWFVAEPVVETPAETKAPQREYRYGRLGKQTEDKLYLNATDGNVYTMLKKFASAQLMSALEKGEYRWFHGNSGSYFVRDAYENKEYLKAEAESFAGRYQAGDIVNLPIKFKNDAFCLVSAGPTVTAKLDRKDTELDYDSLETGEIYTFEILTCSVKDNKLKSDLKLTGKYDTSGTLRRIASLPDPEELEKTLAVPGKMVERLKADDTKKDALEEAVGAPLSIASLKEYIIGCYRKQKEEHTVYTAHRGSRYEIEVELGIRDANGVPLKACMNKTGGHDSFVLALVGATSPDKVMGRYVFVPDWTKAAQELSELALPENWDYSNDESRSKRILSNYLRYSFYKAYLDGDVYEENGWGIFNTGLVDRSYDPIYCLLEPNNNANDAFARKWTISYFACRGKGDNGKDLNRRISRYPNPPRYFKPEEAYKLYFDTTKELYCDYEHILEDNMYRLPEEFIQYTLSYDETLKQMYEDDAPFEKIRTYIMNNARLARDLEDGLKRAVDTAVKYASWNYKTAVPVYYPRNNSISLLLPLNLVGDKPAADAALVIEKLPNGNYQGQTIFTMAMAYQDARQVARPNSDWLQIDAVSEDAEKDEDAGEEEQ